MEHHSLRLATLSRLPISIRRLALLAVEGSGTDFGRLLVRIADGLTMEQRRFCLPVWFFHLDPANIPGGDDVDTLNPVLQRSALSLGSVCTIDGISSEAARQLWPRILQWTEFLQVCGVTVPVLGGEEPACVFLLVAFHHLRGTNGDHVKYVRHTPGVRALVTCAWAYLCDQPEGTIHPGIGYFSGVLRYLMDVYKPENLTEVLEAAGGPGGLASIIVKYLKIILTRDWRGTPERALPMFDAITRFIWDLPEEEGPIYRALLSAGIVAPFTSLICAVSEIGPTFFGVGADAFLLLDCYRILQDLVSASPSRRDLGNSIAAGLLRAIIRSAPLCREVDDLKRTSLWYIINTMLPGATVYYSVLSQLEFQFPDVQELAQTPEFQDSLIYEPWEYFRTVTLVRLAVMRGWRAKRAAFSMRACDNLKCGLIKYKTLFRRCSHCQRMYYCSADCQKTDWRDGSHRDECISIRMSAHTHADIGARNIRFMRALLTTDAWELENAESLGMLLPLIRTRPMEPRVSVIDYTNGEATPRITLLAEERAADTHGDVRWDDHLARVAASGGRMELRVMVVWDGKRRRQLMFPIRAISSEVPDELMRICREMPEDADALHSMRKYLTENGRLFVHQ